MKRKGALSRAIERSTLTFYAEAVLVIREASYRDDYFSGLASVPHPTKTLKHDNTQTPLSRCFYQQFNGRKKHLERGGVIVFKFQANPRNKLSRAIMKRET